MVDRIIANALFLKINNQAADQTVENLGGRQIEKVCVRLRYDYGFRDSKLC